MFFLFFYMICFYKKERMLEVKTFKIDKTPFYKSLTNAKRVLSKEKEKDVKIIISNNNLLLNANSKTLQFFDYLKLNEDTGTTFAFMININDFHSVLKGGNREILFTINDKLIFENNEVQITPEPNIKYQDFSTFSFNDFKDEVKFKETIELANNMFHSDEE